MRLLGVFSSAPPTTTLLHRTQTQTWKLQAPLSNGSCLYNVTHANYDSVLPQLLKLHISTQNQTKLFSENIKHIEK